MIGPAVLASPVLASPVLAPSVLALGVPLAVVAAVRSTWSP